MTNESQPGPGWWKASDGNWYAPEQHPSYKPSPDPTILNGRPSPMTPPVTQAPLPTMASSGPPQPEALMRTDAPAPSFAPAAPEQWAPTGSVRSSDAPAPPQSVQQPSPDSSSARSERRETAESNPNSTAALSEIDALFADAQAKHSASDSRIDAAASLAIYALKGLGLLASRVDSISDRLDSVDESPGQSKSTLDVSKELDKLRAEVRSLSKAVGRNIE
jgi:hypothetical protein